MPSKRFINILLTILLLIVLAILIVAEYTGYLEQVNIEVYKYLPYYNDVWIRLFSLTASNPSFFFILAVLLAYDIYKYRRVKSVTLRVFTASFFVLASVWILKSLFHAPRPEETFYSPSILFAFEHPDLYSFPSGHMARATVISYYYGRGRRGGILWLWDLGVGASRLFLRAHWMGDILTSLMLALLVSMVVDIYSSWLENTYNRIAYKLGMPPIMR